MTSFRACVAAMLLFALAAFAIPQLINYQGQLTAPDGTSLDTTVSITFRILDAPAGGTNLWTETHPLVTVTGGLFHVKLGSVTPLSDLFAANRWLGITVGNNTEMVPRQQIVSVAHAYRVGTVDGASGGTISGKLNVGSGNTNAGVFANVHGASNTASGNNSTVGGGIANTAAQAQATVSGGGSNSASGISATVGGGDQNIAAGTLATVGGGEANRARGQSSVVAGGGGLSQADSNSAIGDNSVVGGGGRNYARGDFSVIAGGGSNIVFPADSNSAIGDHSVISGGKHNVASADNATVSGGQFNTASGVVASVGGGQSNIASGIVATVGGGSLCNARGHLSVVAGGGGLIPVDSNSARGNNSAIVGGQQQDITASAPLSFIGGGYNNFANDSAVTISGGRNNGSNGKFATIGGGDDNAANGDWAAVGGGFDNSASASYSTIPGGISNLASGQFSLAAGRSARATHEGSFVWGCGPVVTDSWGTNTFTARVLGGARFYTSVGGAGVELPAGSGAWANLSDVNQKRLHGGVNTSDILQRISLLSLHRWSYKTQDESIQHIGPTAQDFYAAFGLGDNNTTISTLDPDGVLFAAVQELAKRTEQIDELKTQVAQLQAQIQSLMSDKQESAR